MSRYAHLKLLALALALGGCKAESGTASTVRLPFSDDFNRAELGPNWTVSGGQWRIRDNQVYSPGANNSPLFLGVELPADVVVEVDTMSDTPLVDTKVELMNNGRAHASGYIFILGGWSNALSAICRLDEHGQDRKVRQPTGAVQGRWYHWRIEKKGGALRWLIDGVPYLSFDDAAPLDGAGHNRLAFSNWQNQIHYDNLKIWAYAEAPPVKTSSAAGIAP
jgi:hypothetical protein